MLRRADSWLNMPSRFLAIDGAKLLFSLPASGGDVAVSNDVTPSEKVGVSFKYKHHKHLFSSTILGVQDYPGQDGPVKAMALLCPTSMQRIQRRAFFRAAVPQNRIVRVAFWFGGVDTEPTGATPEHPVWSGKVDDISAGGFQALTRDDVGMGLDVGDMVGLRMTFGLSAEAIYADAQFRHSKPCDDGALLGFQFVGLSQSAQGKIALRTIASKVSEYQRLDLRHRYRKTARAKS